MEIRGLRRELTLWDVVLFNVAAILGLRWIPIAAAAGFVSLTIWVLALVFFFYLRHKEHLFIMEVTQVNAVDRGHAIEQQSPLSWTIPMNS